MPTTPIRLATALAAATALALVPAAGVAKPRTATAPHGEVGHAMVAAANPLATEAGLEVLRAGGTAADAAVAVQAVLGLVEPQSSGLGGGAFMVYRDGATGRVTSYDGRETAPAKATPTLFYGEDDRPLPFFDAVLSGRSTGAPGAIAMLELAQRQHGRLAWASLFPAAERLARQGFIVSPRLAGMIAGRAPQAGTPDTRRYFSRPDGTPLKAGDRLSNALYADALARIAAQGAAGLLRGPVAAEIVARVHEGPRPGSLTTADLAAYRPLAKPALCRPLPRLRDLRAADALGRRGPARAPGRAGADRHRRAQRRRSEGLGAVRPGQPPGLRRPRPLRGRPRLRARAPPPACSTRPMTRRARR